jgi:hypothetical protein
MVPAEGVERQYHDIPDRSFITFYQSLEMLAVYRDTPPCPTVYHVLTCEHARDRRTDPKEFAG